MLDLLDRTDVVVPVLAADEGGGVDGEGVVDVDAAADSAALFGPPDAVLEVGVGEVGGLGSVFGAGGISAGLADDAVLKVSHVVRAHHDALVHALEEAHVVGEGAHDAFFPASIGVPFGAVDGDFDLVAFSEPE